MSKFKITVENTETGKQQKYDADFYSLFARVFGNDNVASATEGTLVPLEVVQIIFAMDHVKESLMKANPDIGLAYALKNVIFGDETVIDLTEMRRQASQMGED